MISAQFEVFLIDLDGVLYLGDEALPSAVESVNRLNNLGKEIRFLTNDPRPERRSVVSKLEDIGIETVEEEVVTSGWATGQYLAKRGISSASVVGSDGLKTELRYVGIDVTDNDPEAVVVGADGSTSYSDIRRATRQINDGALFVGTNPDGAFPTPDGPSPGAGAIVSAVEAAADEEPIIVGKPEPVMFEMALEGLPEDLNVVVIGDNPSTDVVGAHRSGLPAILVSEPGSPFDQTNGFKQPDVEITSLEELFEQGAKSWSGPDYYWADELRPGVGAVVVNGSNEILLSKRADKGRWALPTGNVELLESVEEAVVREVMEEVGLQISVSELTGVYSRPEDQVFSYPTGKTIHFITTCFLCTPEDGNLQPDGEEVIQARFFDPENLPTDDLGIHLEWIAHTLQTEGGPVIR